MLALFPYSVTTTLRERFFTRILRRESYALPKPSPQIPMRNTIINYIRAGYSGIFLVSAEEQRVCAELKSIADYLSYHLLFWSVVDGAVDAATAKVTSAMDPLDALALIEDAPPKTIFLLRDFHVFLDDPNPIVVRKMKDLLLQSKTLQKHIIILGCRYVLPPELEREMTVLHAVLPGFDDLSLVLKSIVSSAELPPISPDLHDAAVSAAAGLTTIEAENAFALSIVETKTINPEVIAREKASTVKKNGILELVESSEDLDSIGGLDELKEWLIQRRCAFSKPAREYGLPPLKGLLILGLAGTGKSLSAKACSKVFGVPLLKLDVGRIFGGLVGQSEANLRGVISTAEALAPCVVWLDELDKAFGSGRSSASDGGTSSRILGSFLSWMQEKTASVFVVATANDVSQLPPELLRKGRWDELFFVDLPTVEERRAIWKIVIRKHRRNPEDFDIAALAIGSNGFTGAEIEAAFIDAMFVAFHLNTEPTDLSIAAVLSEAVPLSKLSAEQINGLRAWAKGRARGAAHSLEQTRTKRLVS